MVAFEAAVAFDEGRVCERRLHAGFTRRLRSAGSGEGVDCGDVFGCEVEGLQVEVGGDAFGARGPGQDHDVVFQMPAEDDLSGSDPVPLADLGDDWVVQVGVLEAAGITALRRG